MKKQIISLTEIKTLVDTFYGKVQKDDLIGPIFNRIIQDKWPEHLEKMYRFWQTVLLDEHSYQGSPFAPHAKLDIGKVHFERWLFLFKETVEENFEGKIADEAKWRANKMAEMFQYKINYIKTNQITPIQ